SRVSRDYAGWRTCVVCRKRHGRRLPTGAVPSMTTARLAVVDEEREFTEFRESLLKTRGYAVDVFHSGAALVERLQAGMSPNLILLDVMMPHLDGIETLRAIRQAQPPPQVIMLSGRHTPATIVEAVRLGAADYVLKPGDSE